MSHFTVVVFGENPDQQLAPYNENLQNCQNAKWDWYSLGGRWSGYFKCKSNVLPVLGEPGVFENKPKPGYADCIRKENIDVEGMRQDEKEQHIKYYKSVCDIINSWRVFSRDSFDKLPKPISWKTFKKFIDEKTMTLDEARATYNNQGFVKKLSEKDFWFFNEDPIEDIWSKTENEYVEEKMKGCMVPYAFVINGEWFEKGQTDWWGVTIKENDYDEYCKKFWQIFNSVPDETMIWLYDCHI